MCCVKDGVMVFSYSVGVFKWKKVLLFGQNATWRRFHAAAIHSEDLYSVVSDERKWHLFFEVHTKGMLKLVNNTVFLSFDRETPLPVYFSSRIQVCFWTKRVDLFAKNNPNFIFGVSRWRYYLHCSASFFKPFEYKHQFHILHTVLLYLVCYLQEEFIWQSRASWVSDHALYSHDLHVFFFSWVILLGKLVAYHS